MQLIDHIHSESELISVRDHLQKVLAAELSITPKLRRVNEVTAKLIGVADWNTALGVIAHKTTVSSSFPGDSPESIYSFLCALSNGDPENSFALSLDDMVFDHCGTSKSHSVINNAGVREQVSAIIKSIGIDNFWLEMSNTLAITRYWYELWRQYGVADKQYQPVEATVHDDGHLYQISFDAAPYFFQALKDDTLVDVLEELSNNDWSNSEATDEIANYFEDGCLGEGQSAVSSMIKHLRIRRKDPALYDISGFDCQVSKCSVRDWVVRHAPNIIKYRSDIFENND